ncbi:FIG00813825: hypothetical protein [Richelia intracellularis HH01]|uniref:SAM-dependent methyltransferase n=1 Tax=Richelia intracellularis HH01 TaxID=1165094 RepID=M1X0R1_9NOST|nr:DUF938 domain-containing protein [Richelia intracellularis]CCH67638.1 FIG00813825: hypothetical protein [Richelia intracellularis HH01]HAE06089.1 DUF938 domain-containing protein [Richelia sp.]
MRLPDNRKYAPAVQRNREPILEILEQVLPSQGTILEISSGTGEHAVFFAPRLRPRIWQTSEPDVSSRESVVAWIKNSPTDNLYFPLDIDVSSTEWAVKSDRFLKLVPPINAIVNINMIHIAPWIACLGLIGGANLILPTGGILYLYGPYKQGQKHTTSSNEAFDISLRAQNPEWGVRNLEDVIAVASKENFNLLGIYNMPANNLSLVFQHQ